MANKLYILLVVVLSLVGWENSVTAQNSLGSRAEIFTVEDGLSQTHVNQILLDSKGYLWICTKDGLNRYDGNGFYILRHNPLDTNSLCDNNVRHVCEDHAGNIWIATINGLSKYDPNNGTFTNFYNDTEDPNTLSDNSLYYVYEDREGIIWVKTLKSLEKYDKKAGRFVHFYHYNNVFNYSSGDFNFPIYEDKDGKLWVGTLDGLNCFDKNLELFERFEYNKLNSNSISDNKIRTICEDVNKNLWIGTNNGLNVYDKKNKKFTRFFNVPGNISCLPSNIINDIFPDNNGLLWISTQKGISVYNLKNKNFTQYKSIDINGNTYPLSAVKTIIKDSANIYWIGASQGLVKIDRKPFKFKLYRTFNKQDDFTGLNITSLYVDGENNEIWAGTEGSGIHVYNTITKSLKKYNTENTRQLKDNDISALYFDRTNKLWIGTNNGIAIYDKNSKQFFDFASLFKDCQFLENNKVHTFFQDDEGQTWIGTQHGLHLVNYNTKEIRNFIQLPDSQGITLSTVYAIAEDTSKTIWFGTNQGLVKYNQKTKHYFKYEADNHAGAVSLANNSVYSLLYSSKNELWIGTTSGLSRYNFENNNFILYSEEDGLPNNLIYSILEDNSHNIWLSTNKGLVMYNTKQQMFLSYDIADGLQNLQFNPSSACKSKSGELFFGGINGLNSFFPDSLKINQIKPNVEITSIEIIGGKFRKKITVLPNKTIRIPAGTTVFIINFAVLDFTYPRNNQYMYMLATKNKEGLWVNNGNRNYASFSNLPAGKYTFHVKGANSDLVWGSKEYSINIIVESPIWTSRSAILIYILFLISAGYGTLQWRTRKLRQTNKMLMEKETAAKEIARQKEELTIKNKNITDSINYAKRIQVAMMPSEKTFKRLLPNSFVYHKPRDIVSGDFYWIHERNGKVFVAAVDCTGHGVPGAFMSILGVELFRKIMIDQLESPGEILSKLNEDFSRIFSDLEDVSLKDGMDISFCVIDKVNNILYFAGAFNPLYLIRDNKIIETKGNRFSVSMEKRPEKMIFQTNVIPLNKHDMIYIFSDGYADQFGGYEGKKFKYRRFRHMLLNIHKLPLDEQKVYIEESMNAWKGKLEQVDDILVIGIRADF
jgi:ligand-binding sensor domain-containing protein/serine phosphatase RsbU (regulator of sigma subunit)